MKTLFLIKKIKYISGLIIEYFPVLHDIIVMFFHLTCLG